MKSKEDYKFFDAAEVSAALAPAPKLRLSSEKAVLGADYSASAAYLALVRANSVLTTATLHVDKDPRGFWLVLKGWIKSIDENYDISQNFYIEMPWVRNDHYPHAGVAMMRTATFIELACYEQGLTPVLASPGTWRKEIYGSGRPKGDLKELARATVEERFGFKTHFKKDHNICEAILIASYGSIVDGESGVESELEESQPQERQP